ALLKALMTLDGVNLSKLQSYPVPSQPWHYSFHVDMEFECMDDYISALNRLQGETTELHVYGVYKKAINQYIYNDEQ
ncbi:MAG: chorismate mutase, partial [Tidjanibacter sp.]|nr:chorismate mutase [Tidjanibacter sp.]